MRGLRRSKRWLAMLLAFTLAFSNVAYLDTPMVTYAAEETPDDTSSEKEETAAEETSEDESDTEQEEAAPEESSDSQETTEEPTVEEEPEQPSVEEKPTEPVEGNPEETIPDTEIVEEPTEEDPDEVIEEEVPEEEEKDEEDEKPATYEVTFKASGDNGTVKVRMPDSEESEKIDLNKGFSGTVEEDSTVTFSVQADEGYSIDKVEVNKERKYADSQDGDVYTYELENIDSEKNVKIFFVEEEPEEEVEEEPTEGEEDPELESYKLTVNVPEANGTVTVTTPEAKKADASKGYSTTVEEGSEVSLTVAPDEGYEIDSVSVNGKDAEASTETEDSSTYEIAEIKEDTEVTVTFAEKEAEDDPALEEELNEYEVTVDVLEDKGAVEVTTSEGKTVDASEGYSETVKEGSTISLEVEPEKGYKGVVKVNGKTVKATSKSLKSAVYAVKEITSDIAIEVSFVEEADLSLMPKQELTAEAGGVTVTVKAEAGVLPEGTKVVAKEVSSSKVEDAIAETMEEDKEIVSTTAIDVTLQDQDGNEVQPAEGRNVVVEFSGISTDGEADSMAVYHVDDAGESADKVTGDRAVSDSVVFTAGHFSIYVVVNNVSMGDYTNRIYECEAGSSFTVESYKNWNSSYWSSSNDNVARITSGNNKYGSKTITVKISDNAADGATAVITRNKSILSSDKEQFTIKVKNETSGVTPVYVYLKINGSTEGWVANKEGWFTIGKIEVPGLESATKYKHNQIYNGFIDEKGIMNIISTSLKRHPDNSTCYFDPSSSDVYQKDLIVAQGATGYLDEAQDGVNAWHLNFYMNAPKKVTLTINYVDTEGNIVHEQYKEEKNFGSSYNVPSPSIDGYSLVNKDQEVIEVDKLLTSVTYDVIYQRTSTGTIDVDGEGATIAGNNLSWVYDGQSHSGTARVIDAEGNVVEGYTVTYSTPNSVKDVSEGKVEVTATAKKTGYTDITTTFTIQITAKELTVKAVDASKNFGENDPASFAYTVNGEVGSEKAGFNGSLSRKAGEAVGHYEIQQGNLELKDNGSFKAGNYKLKYEKGDFEIKTAQSTGTIDVDGEGATIAGNNLSWVYDGQSHSGTARVIDAEGNVVEGYTVTYSTPNSVKDVSEGKVEVTATAKKTGYTDITTTFTIQITAKPVTITVEDAEKFLGAADPTFKGRITSGSLVAEKDLGEISYIRTNASVNEIGEYKDVLTVSYKENSNYNVTVVPGKFKITGLSYIVRYVDENGEPVEKEKKVPDQSLNKDITEDAITISGYALDEAESSKTITIDADETKNIITFVYSVDTMSDPDEDTDDNPENGDGVPDKYQIRISFAVSNGTWVAGSITSRVLTLKDADGHRDVDGTATVAASMVPRSRANRGYEDGKWNVNPANYKLTKIDDGKVFRIRYSEIPGTPTPDPEPEPEPDPTPTPVPPTPTPEPTPEPAPAPTPAPAPAPAPAPVAAAPAAPVVAVPDAPVPLAGIDLGEEEEGEEPVGIEQVVNLDEEEVPLANEDLHDCCIFHFLEMLLALILLAWYTHDSKKRQQKIFELREQLGTEQTKRGISPRNYSAR